MVATPAAAMIEYVSTRYLDSGGAARVVTMAKMSVDWAGSDTIGGPIDPSGGVRSTPIR